MFEMLGLIARNSFADKHTWYKRKQGQRRATKQT
jgi:hypothetical protein